ncbi:jg22601 [Pararge aegeria aegeria]|uniref:Jg22601 protein n=1 Tax=Pararge aegeria aegeria TaxID=348720 RepID=A0A8S4SMD4_9NEOP|nr:jg22601 [Pararge aegeria aegeria]
MWNSADHSGPIDEEMYSLRRLRVEERLQLQCFRSDILRYYASYAWVADLGNTAEKTHCPHILGGDNEHLAGPDFLPHDNTAMYL